MTFSLFVSYTISSKNKDSNAETRNTIFKREMPLALQAIYHADEQLFNANPELKNTPILIYFISSQTSYNRLYDFGTIGEYTIIKS